MLLLACGATAFAHPFEFTQVNATFRRDGHYQIDVTYHVDAMLAEVPLGDLSEAQYRELRALPETERARRIEMARRYVQVMIGIRFDGRPAAPVVTFPRMDEPHTPGEAPLPGHLVRLAGPIPDGAREFVFAPAPVFNLIVLRIHEEGQGEVAEQVLEPVESSRPYRLGLAPPVPARLTVAGRYLRLGFEHILPKGLDHVLFVLGLYLLGVGLRPLLWQVSAFTAAHTLTLALSMYGVVALSRAVVEPLIALSIACVAIENLFTSRLMPWRPFVVFGFGLLHGLGFADALAGLGLPRARYLTALVTFNAGVELGQLAVLVLAFALVGVFRRRPWYRGRIAVPVSGLIAIVGLYWAVLRVMS